MSLLPDDERTHLSRPDPAVIEEVALLKGVSESFVEKDWYVTQVIQLLTAVNMAGATLIFCGGTALSKAHKLIQRFSEDIDFRIVAPALIELGSAAKRRFLAAFKQAVVSQLRTQFSISNTHVKACNGNQFFTVSIHYASQFAPQQALRPHILVEMTFSQTHLPVCYLSVSSFINELTKQPAEVAHIGCLNPIENAVDKLSALTWRVPGRVRGEMDNEPSVVRHIHDLAILQKVLYYDETLVRLIEESLRHDQGRSSALTGLSPKARFEQLLAILTTDMVYETEYNRFVRGMSYASGPDTPTYEKAVEAVKSVIESYLAASLSRGQHQVRG